MSEETYEKLRIARISDCVFAIAMTLLVFDLKLPVLEAPISNQAFAQALLGHLPNFTSWLAPAADTGISVSAFCGHLHRRSTKS